MSAPRLPGHHPCRGFSLIELLVALTVFAAMAAAAYAGLAAVARTRTALAAGQDRLAAVMRAFSDLDRDLGQALARPVRGNDGAELPALIGAPDHLELTRLGFANPRAEARSNLERAFYQFGDGKLERGRYAVLDRAPDSLPGTRVLLDHVAAVAIRYLDAGGVWRDTWPPPADRGVDPVTALPRAVEWRMRLDEGGELRRVFELPSGLPALAVGRAPAPAPDDGTARRTGDAAAPAVAAGSTP
jgi:general secretion pathway protein J